MTWQRRSLSFGDREFFKFSDAVKRLGQPVAIAAFRSATNHTGDRGRTQVVRTLARQVGLPQGRMRKLGAIKIYRASARDLSYKIESSGRSLPLREFNARQFSWGVRASPWGKSQRFKGTFINRGTFRSGISIRGGMVFNRVTTASKPLEMLYGPSIPEEMVKGDTAQAFERVSEALPARLLHEVRRLTGGVVT